MKTPALSKLLTMFLMLLLVSFEGRSQSETFSTGSFIINMGATNPGTIANSIKPYGLIYDLIRNYKVPVKFIVNQLKAKDGVDFTYNAVQYKGGTFIIKSEYRSAAVNSRITFWTGQGVVGTTTTSSLTLNVTRTINSYPHWTLDAQNGQLAEKFLLNAGISNTSFPGAYNWKTPAQLNGCDDFFVLPHADPSWAVHGPLWSWNKNYLGCIWSGCHAVSVLENMFNPANPSQKTNFLTTTGLVPFGSHGDGSPPYTHQYPTDPVAQYMGKTDLAQLSGSEQIYLPKLGGAWNAGAKLIAYDPTQADVPIRSPGAAAAVVYGRAMDDPTRGFVMYEGGHDLNKGSANDAAAQRIFFNFSFYYAVLKNPAITVTGLTEGQQIQSGNTIVGLNVVATSPIAGTTFTYQWSSSCGGSFSNPTGATTNFTAPAVANNTSCSISCVVTDNCGRSINATFIIQIIAVHPPVATNDAQTMDPGCGNISLTYNVLTNDTDQDGQPLTLTTVTSPSNGVMSFDASGNITYTPNLGFAGVETFTYTVCDNTTPAPLCATGTYTITVGNPANVPNTANDAFTIKEDIVGRFNVLSNDLPVVSGPLTISAITVSPANGRVSINTDNTITYLPNADFAGIDNFTYRIVNSLGYSKTATVTVTITNDACDAGTLPITPTIAAKLTLNPTADTYIDQSLAGTNFGAAVTLGTNRNAGTIQRTLMNFNVSTIPATAKIGYARLYLNQITARTDIIAAYRANAAWTEVGANWTNMNANFVGTTAYPSAGITPITGWNALDVTSLVQSWVDGSFANQGLMIKVMTESGGANIATYHSKETLTASLKPYLEIVYATNTGGIASANLIDTADTYVDQNVPAVNYGSANPLNTDKSNTRLRRSLFKFDMSTLPANIAIAEGQVNLNQVTNKTDIHAIHRVTAAWDESAVMYNTIPAFDATQLPAAGFTPVTGFNAISIGSLPQQWLDGTYTNLGVMLKVASETGSSNIHTWSSREDATVAKRPYLNVTYFTNGCQTIPTRAPLAMPDTATTPNGLAVNIATATNDYYPAAGAKTYSIITAPASGTATINASTGLITYTPATTYNGVRSMVYRVLNTVTGLADTAYAYVNITNGAIVANDDYPAGALSGIVQTINVKANDTDPENPVLDASYPVSIISPPTNGTALVNGSGNVVYTPDAGFSGNDTLFYSIVEPAPLCGSIRRDTAMVVIVVMNRPPVPVNDNTSGPPCNPITINLVANDSDPEGNTLTVTNLSALNPPAAGSLTNNNDGTVTFGPANGFTGIVTFTYRLLDNGVPPQLSAPATVTINIIAIVNNPPVAVNDNETIGMDETLYANVRNNDYDPDQNDLTIPVVTVLPLHGTASVNAVNGLIVYIPNPGFFGTDVLTYQICDKITTNPATCAPGIGSCVTATLTINITIPNSTYAVNDENSTWINIPVSGVTIINDFDLERDIISFGGFIDNMGAAKVSGTITVSGFAVNGSPVANAGTLAIQATGAYTFTPVTGFTGYMRVPYIIFDNQANTASDTGYLAVTVSPLLTAANSLIANNDEDITYGATISRNLFENDRKVQNYPFQITGFIYDSNGDGNPESSGSLGTPVNIGGLTVTDKSVVNAGSFVLNANGNYTFTPAADFHGSVNINYSICDNTNNPFCATAQLQIKILPNGNGGANDPPFGGDDFEFTYRNLDKSGTFINNDREPNGNPISFQGVTINTAGPHNLIQTRTTLKGGSVNFYSDGKYLYTPLFNYTGPDLVTYSLCDVTATAPQPICAGVSLHMLVAQVGNVLPLELLDFNGKLNAGKVDLYWVTANEVNAANFVIERSTDGLYFTPIGTVKASGTSSNVQNYKLVDALPANGSNYYRLKMYDNNGAYTYSKTIIIRINSNVQLTTQIMPNPITSYIDVYLTLTHNTPVEFRLFDIGGKLVFQKSVKGYKGFNWFTIRDLDKLSSGMHLLKIVTDTDNIVEKLIKQ